MDYDNYQYDSDCYQDDVTAAQWDQSEQEINRMLDNIERTHDMNEELKS